MILFVGHFYLFLKKKFRTISFVGRFVSFLNHFSFFLKLFPIFICIIFVRFRIFSILEGGAFVVKLFLTHYQIIPNIIARVIFQSNQNSNLERCFMSHNIFNVDCVLMICSPFVSSMHGSCGDFSSRSRSTGVAPATRAGRWRVVTKRNHCPPTPLPHSPCRPGHCMPPPAPRRPVPEPFCVPWLSLAVN